MAALFLFIQWGFHCAWTKITEHKKTKTRTKQTKKMGTSSDVNHTFGQQIDQYQRVAQLRVHIFPNSIRVAGAIFEKVYGFQC